MTRRLSLIGPPSLAFSDSSCCGRRGRRRRDKEEGVDVIENSEILADGMIGAAAFFLLSREVEMRGYVQPITNMGGAVQTGNGKTNQI